MTFSLKFTIDADFEPALRALDPQQVYVVLNRWYAEGSKLAASEVRARAKPRLKSKVYVLFDSLRPPRWARIGVRAKLATVLEAGTGRLGDPAFSHVARHWPSTEAIMAATGLPKPQAFLVARAVGMRGGNPAQPFIRPAWQAIHGRVEGLMESIAREVLAG